MKADFIQRVMQVMNELGWDDTGSDAFVGADTTKVKAHIERVFVDAWRMAVNQFPKTYFTTKDFSKQRLVHDITQGVGYVVLPDDFYKLSAFKLKGWFTACETLVDNDDPIARRQANEYVRGSVTRPVCVKNNRGIVRADEDTPPVFDILCYYSIPKGNKAIIEEALYIPLEEPLSDNTKLNEKLIRPLAYLCASMVFYIFEKPDIAKTLEAQAMSIIR